AQIGELSGGQQQRVFLARALAQSGDVLLLDEPLTGVDASTQAVVLELLGDLRRSWQAILMTTHDLPQAAAVCDRLCLLNRRAARWGCGAGSPRRCRPGAWRGWGAAAGWAAIPPSRWCTPPPSRSGSA